MASTAALPHNTPISEPAAAYFEKAWPAAVILATFFAVTLPMAVVVLVNNALVAWLYMWLFAVSHFVVTLTIYLNSSNLRYFSSSWNTVTTFFVVPFLIFVAFDLIHAFRVSATLPTLALFFFGAVRLFDLWHFNRQTFGVLQMFKARTKATYPTALRTAENRYYISFVVLLMTTFLSGGVCPLLQENGLLSLARVATPEGGVRAFSVSTLQVLWVGVAATTASLFLVVVRGHWQMARSEQRRSEFGHAIAYIGFQSLSGLMAAIYFPLYLAALATHYVEYHVLMIPRCLHSPLNPGSPLDRRYSWFRQRPVLYYVLLLCAAAVVTAGVFVGMNAAMGAPIVDVSSPIGYLMLIAAFDGIFVFHYFVEMHIWKFSDPHFRQMMAGLYFAPTAR